MFGMSGLKMSVLAMTGLLILSLACAVPLFQPRPKVQVLVETVVVERAEVSLVGIYDPQDPSARARQFRERLSNFEAETGSQVNYASQTRDVIGEYILTNLAAGVPIDLASVKPEMVAQLVEADLLLSFDELGQAQLASPYLGDSACLVRGKRYCATDIEGLAWVIPKHTAHPAEAFKLLALLVK
jgi:hypothetical protein